MQVARRLGANLKAPAVIELRSDIGGGKTSFVRGLVEGLGSNDQVASPTFTISRHYRIPKNDTTVHHFDFYRLVDPGIMEAEVRESVQRDDVITIVEWADVVQEVLPEDRLIIEFTVTGESGRLISCKAGPNHAYVLKGLA